MSLKGSGPDGGGPKDDNNNKKPRAKRTPFSQNSVKKRANEQIKHRLAVEVRTRKEAVAIRQGYPSTRALATGGIADTLEVEKSQADMVRAAAGASCSTIPA